MIKIGSKNDHFWNVAKLGDGSINLNSISVSDKFGETISKIDKAFFLPMIFKKVNEFRLIFDYKTSTELENKHNVFVLPDQTFYLANTNGKWHIIFKFNVVVNGGIFNNVVFTNDRMYSTPIF